MKMSPVTRLVVFVACALGLPAVLLHLFSARAVFNAEPVAALRARAPEIVLIGDSILNSSIDARQFEKHLGIGRTEILWNGGAASAAWFLMLKNWVIASDVRPRFCVIFFRDRLLTAPTFRTTPGYRNFLDSLKRDEEPVVKALLAGNDRGGHWLHRAIALVYPGSDEPNVHQEKLSRLAARVAALFGEHGPSMVRRRINETFDVARLRDEVMPESFEVSAEGTGGFDPSPQRSFLPHIVEAAAAAGIPLVFVREKRWPGPDGRVEDSEQLRHYIADLRAWLESRGCTFIDLTDEPALTREMFLKEADDHTAPAAKARVTEIYAEKLRPVLAP